MIKNQLVKLCRGFVALTKFFILMVCFSYCNTPQKPLINEKRELKIIPLPVQIEPKDGNFLVFSTTRILYEGEDSKPVAEYFSSMIEKGTGLKLKIKEASSDNGKDYILLSVKTNKKEIGNEGYEIGAGKDSVMIHANTSAGLFWAIQTVRQMLPSEIERPANQNKGINWTIPSSHIVDYPRFGYRGAMLDVSRHFFSVDFVKKYIDNMSKHKLNVFHWHLTDDHGWRIEIKKYPKLTQIGSKRRQTYDWKTDKGDGKEYSGFYTQEQIKDIVKYAQERHVMVIPEIEMPGHSLAALAAYPQFSCTNGTFEPMTRWGGSDDIFCAGNDSTFIFIQDVLNEVINLFPSPYIHIGGDEVMKNRWRQCQKCQKRIKDELLKDEDELQSYFIRRIDKFLSIKGKKMIGWDEIVEGGLSKNATVMAWRGANKGSEVALQNHDVIMSPNSHLYFDSYQADNSIEPKAIGYWLPLERVYDFEPVPQNLNDEQAKHILGAEAPLWSEYIDSEAYAEYMVMPRWSALAEITWSPKASRNIADFKKRMKEQYRRYAFAGINFRLPTPIIDKIVVLDLDSKLRISNPTDSAQIRYTLDGSEPTLNSNLYKEPFVLDKNSIVKTRLFMYGKSSSIITSNVVLNSLAPAGKKYGVRYWYYEGEFAKLPDFKTIALKDTGQVSLLGLKNIKHRSDNFAFVFKGYINIEKDADYTFYLRSSNESRLLIDEKEVAKAENTVNTTKQTLKIGLHTVTIEYCKSTGSETLELMYESEGIKKQPLLLFTDR